MNKSCKTCKYDGLGNKACLSCRSGNTSWEPKEAEAVKRCYTCQEYIHSVCIEPCLSCDQKTYSNWIPKETETILFKEETMDKNYQAKVFVQNEDKKIVACLSAKEEPPVTVNPKSVPTIDIVATDDQDARDIINTTNATAIESLRKKGKVVYDIAPFPASKS